MVMLSTRPSRVRPDDSEILALAKQQKRAIMKRDAGTLQTLWQSWSKVQATLADEAARVANDIKERIARGMAATDWRIKQLETYQLLEATAKRETEIFLGLARDEITDLGSEFAVAGRIDAGELLSKITGRPISDVVGSFAMLPREAITTMLATTGPGSPLDRLLHAIPISDVWEGVPNKLLEGLALGKNPRAIGRQIANEFHLPLSRSMAIARTESMRAYRLSSQEFYRSTGIVEGYKRLSARDERVCAACLASDGKLYKLSDEFAEHVNGRCTQIPVLDGYEPQFETGSEWFAKQPESVQRHILGPTRFDYYRRGMSLDEMWERVPNKVWGPANVLKPLSKLEPPTPVKGIWEERPWDISCSMDPNNAFLNTRKVSNWFTNEGETITNEVVRAKAKDKIVTDLSSRTGIAYDDVNTFIQSWAMTSNDDDWRALQIQKVASDLFSTKPSPWQEKKFKEFMQKRLDVMTNPNSSERFNRTLLSHWENEIGEIKPHLRAMGFTSADEVTETLLKAMYENTQDAFRSAGIKNVMLYRGVQDTQITKELENILQKKGEYAIVGKLEIQNAMESWSLQESIAKSFAGQGNGFVMKMVVPVERIIGTARTGFGCLHEWEFVVINSGLLDDTIRVAI